MTMSESDTDIVQVIKTHVDYTEDIGSSLFTVNDLNRHWLPYPMLDVHASKNRIKLKKAL